MFNSIVKKIFVTIVSMFVFIMLIQLLFQNFFLEEIYINMKIAKIERSFNKFCNDYDENKWNNKRLNKESIDYQDQNGASIIVFDKKDNVLNDVFFEEFNYITIKDEKENEFKIIIDFLINENGEFVYSNNEIKNGDKINILGTKIIGTNFIDPLDIKIKESLFINDQAHVYFEELYQKNPDKLTQINGVVISKNLIIRDNGVLSYQHEKLYNEVRAYWIEREENYEDIRSIINDGNYDFIEEYSGLIIVVLVKEIEDINGNTNYVFSLFNIENIHDAFQILNEYYYYIFGFQLILILLLVYFYSKWISKPLIKLIACAKSISELDFTKRTDIKSNDELSVLSDSLNNISKNLSSTIKNLELSNNELAIEAIKKEENEKRMRNLLTSLSHEFKTPLGIISGFLEIISDGVYEKEPEYYINVISDEIDKLNRLVIETIELSKLESRNYKLNLSEFKISYFLEILVDKFEKKLKDKNMKYEIKIEDITVYADMGKIEQVIINLLSNGIKYSPKDEKIEIDSYIKKDNLYIRIKNYGVLIEAKDLEKIWDRFYRVDQSRNRNLGGSGLGLTIVKNILDLHESDYGVKNINNGVEFYFSLKIKS
jgi:signal transduction histidine kinase